MKIANKISSIFIVFALLLLSILAYFFYFYVSGVIKSEESLSLEAKVRSRGRQIEIFLEQNKKKVFILSKHADFPLLLSGALSNASEDYSNIASHDNYSLKEILFDSNFYELFLLDMNGAVVLTTNPDEEIGTDFSKEPFFAEVKNEIYVSGAFLDAEFERQGYIISAPVFDKGKFLGVLAARLDISGINDIISKQKSIDTKESFYLVNRNKLAISPIESFENTFLNLKIDTFSIRHCFEKSSQIEHLKPSFQADVKGDMVLSSHYYLKDYDWCLVGDIPADIVKAPVNQLIYRFIFLALVLLVFFISSLLLFVKIIVDPIKELKKGFDIVNKGDFSHRIKIKSKDEIGDLADGFNEMSDKLRLAKEKTEDRIRERTEMLEKINKYSTGRELKMVELKKEIKKLKEKK